VEWAADRGGGARQRLTLLWRETGGPPVVPPMTKGFGSTVIGTIVERQLKGELSTDWAAEGLAFRLAIPLEPGGGRDRRPPARPEPAPPVSKPASGAVLVVEDEALVGMQMRCALEGTGFAVRGPAA
jgi:hypothetical protein